MKRRGIFFAGCLGGLLGGLGNGVTLSASAQQYAEEVAATLAEESGSAAVTQQLDWDLRTVLEQMGLSVSSPEQVGEHFTLAGVWDVLRDFCADRIQLPFQMLGGLLTVILFAALLEGMQCSTSHAATVRVFDYVCALAAVSLLADPLFQSIAAVQTALEQGASFMTAFVPVFAGILAAGGTAGTAVCYQTGVIALSDGVLQLICHTLLPLSRKVTTWTLGLLMSVFLGVLSMQNLISGSTDTAAAKTTRYVLSNFVPVVGSAVSDAYATVRGSLQILRSTTGVLGIMALCLLFLPPLLQLLLYRMVVAVGAAAAELFGTQRLLRLLRGTQQALAIAFALLVCFAVMFIVATAVAMTIGKGGV